MVRITISVRIPMSELANSDPGEVLREEFLGPMRVKSYPPLPDSARVSRDDDLRVRPSNGIANGVRNKLSRLLDSWPTRCGQNDNRDRPTGEILLVLKIPIGSYEHIEAF